MDRTLCSPDASCLCVRACPGGALGLYGRRVTVAEVLRTVLDDQVFYVRSGGGMTLGGGEPLAQPDFALALLRQAKKARIRTNIETCGQVPGSVVVEAARLLDSMYMDIKCMDAEKHRAWTGAGNERVLENLALVREACPDLPVTVRTPVIPGFNDNAQDIGDIARFVRRFASVRYELLPYHRYGEHKYLGLGRSPGMGDAELSRDTMPKLRALAAEISGGDGEQGQPGAHTLEHPREHFPEESRVPPRAVSPENGTRTEVGTCT